MSLQKDENPWLTRVVEREPYWENHKFPKLSESMSAQNASPWREIVVPERISYSENEKFDPLRSNNVYRYFSKSSNNLYNNYDRYFDDFQPVKSILENNFEFVCSQCKKRTKINESFDRKRKLQRTNSIDKILKNNLNVAPYTFDNSTRMHKNSQQLADLDYLKLYNELRKIKKEQSQANLEVK